MNPDQRLAGARSGSVHILIDKIVHTPRAVESDCFHLGIPVACVSLLLSLIWTGQYSVLTERERPKARAL
jgi:hypothetical protein